jgi:hypothetical protein
VTAYWRKANVEIRRGTTKSFDSGAYTATVQMAGSLATWLQGVPVARNIPSAEMVAGRSCALILFDTANPQDAVLAAVWV